METTKKRGRPKKSVDAAVKPEEVVAALEKEQKGTTVELPVEDIREISVTSRQRVSLSDPQYDPFKKHKTDPSMYYRAINTRPHLLRKREAEGYKVVTENGKAVEYGDLVLAKLPRDVRNERENYVKEKTRRQARAAVEQFKSEAEKHGVDSYEEK